MLHFPVDDMDVWKKVMILSNGKAAVPNNISAETLVISLPVVLEPPNFLVNQSLSLVEVPDRIEYPRVMLLSNGRTRSDVNKRRPVSMLPTLSKIL